ncbi:helix-turn-helix domain-containing protein [Porphyrobacter sp. ULC335]|uniref:helix-turn-helix domain-containing protein n=1 Tax=Porphyrobacter sp. ULC335 TaxID=2854260 RepID=UPI00221FB08C|nr:helix-turn-helix domain-containing protein [Porphyrobacter sp. ULC335]UYV15431.1 helix-turn-helix domain-containing protein [Porphyrobacter sp. ULC335]
MASKVAARNRSAGAESGANAESSALPTRFGVQIPQEIAVKAIRTKLGMTQLEFASRFGFSIKTLQQWEQKQRVPEGPTRAYLLVINRDPEAVQRALGSAT